MLKQIAFCITLLLLVQSLQANGAADKAAEYHSMQKSLFSSVIRSVGSGEMTAAEGKREMADLRNRYRRFFTDEDGIIESLIDQVKEALITPEEALHQFALLRNGELMASRKNQPSQNNHSSSPGQNSGSGSGSGNNSTSGSSSGNKVQSGGGSSRGSGH